MQGPQGTLLEWLLPQGISGWEPLHIAAQGPSAQLNVPNWRCPFGEAALGWAVPGTSQKRLHRRWPHPQEASGFINNLPPVLCSLQKS